MSTGHRPGGDSEVPGPCRARPGPPARPWLIPCPHPSCLTASPQDRSHGSLRSEGGVRHGCEPRAQGRPGPAGEKDGDTATGACAVSVHGCVNVRVHCAGRGVRAGLHKCPKQSGAGTSHRAGGREMHKEHAFRCTRASLWLKHRCFLEGHKQNPGVEERSIFQDIFYLKRGKNQGKTYKQL